MRAPDEERARTNLGGTRALFQACVNHGARRVVFIGRHTYYGASPDAPLYHTEDEPPHGVGRVQAMADLAAADLYAAQMLWREPKLVTTVLRLVYFLGASHTGTLAGYLDQPYVPRVAGFDPLYQFLDESDAAAAIALAAEAAVPGIFNVSGPQPLPLSAIIRGTGGRSLLMPEGALRFLKKRGRFGGLAPGGIAHLKYPIVVDSRAFLSATGFRHARSERDCMDSFRVTARPSF
jgi:UDP-glucose 4-epimerase